MVVSNFPKRYKLWRKRPYSLVTAQLAEQLLRTSKVHGSNPVISKFSIQIKIAEKITFDEKNLIHRSQRSWQSSYFWHRRSIVLIHSSAIFRNSSLTLKLSHTWLRGCFWQQKIKCSHRQWWWKPSFTECHWLDVLKIRFLHLNNCFSAIRSLHWLFKEYCLKYGPIPSSFPFLFLSFSHHKSITNWKKRRWSTWYSNPGPQYGRRRRNHRAMAATTLKNIVLC